MSELAKKLFEDVELGKQALFEALEEGSYVLNCHDTNGFTLLHRAVQLGHNEIVKILLKKGADVKARCRWRSTPLHEAAYSGNVLIAKVLLEHGANVQVFTDWGETPLIFAVYSRKIKMVKLLLQHGPYLHNKEMIKSYVDRNKYGQPILHLIAGRKSELPFDKILAEVFLEYGASLEIMWRGLTPLQIAVKKNKVLLTETFLEKGAEVNVSDEAGRTPLQCAVINKNREIVNILLKYGAN